MKRLWLALLLLVLTAWHAPANAQSPVTVIGAITAGDCVKFNSNTIITDAGFICTGQGILPNASVAGTVLYYNGTAWVIFAGNTSGTNCLGENAVGAPQWTTCSGGSGANPGGTNGQLQINASGTFGGITVGSTLNIASTTLNTASVANNTLMGNISGGSAAPAASTPTAFWDSFCGNTIGFIWARMTGGWACGASFAAPVTWWGAACNGSTNDTTAINTAIASGIKKIIITGTCNVTTLTQLPTNFTLEGQNRLDSCIQTTSTTGNVISLNNGDVLQNLCVTSSATRTAGALILASAVVNISLNTLTLSNFFDGIVLNGVGSPAGVCPVSSDPCSGVHARDIRMYGPTTAGADDCILIEGASGSAQPYNTDVYFNDVFCTGASTSAYLANGVQITACGDCHFDHLQTVFAGASPATTTAGFHIVVNGTVATGNSVQWVQCAHCLFDSGGGSGALFRTLNGAGIFTAKIVDSWSSSNASGYGVGIATDTGHSSAINGVDIVDSVIGGNTTGIAIFDSSNVSYTNITGNCIGGNNGAGGDGVYVGTGITSFRISNNKIGACSVFGVNGTGLYMAGGVGTLANGMTIGNDISQNTTNVFSNGANPIVKANNINY